MSSKSFSEARLRRESGSPPTAGPRKIHPHENRTFRNDNLPHHNAIRILDDIINGNVTFTYETNYPASPRTGYRNRETAYAIDICIVTVDTHLSTVLRPLAEHSLDLLANAIDTLSPHTAPPQDGAPQYSIAGNASRDNGKTIASFTEHRDLIFYDISDFRGLQHYLAAHRHEILANLRSQSCAPNASSAYLS